MIEAFISVEDLKEMKNAKEFESLCRPLIIDEIDIHNEFFKKRFERYGFEAQLIYHFNPYLRYYDKCANYKYIIVEMGDDKVIAYFKHINLYNLQYLRMDHMPTSLSGNHNNEIILIGILFRNKLMEQMCYLEKDLAVSKALRINRDDIAQHDFYSIVDERYEHIYTNAWIKNARVRKFINNPKVELRRVKSSDILEIEKLLDAWVESKRKRGFKVRCTRLKDNILKELNICADSSNLDAFGVFYNNIPLIIGVFLKCIDGGIGLRRFELEISCTSCDDDIPLFDNCTEEEKSEISVLKNYVSRTFMYYFVGEFKKMGVKAYYEGGFSLDYTANLKKGEKVDTREGEGLKRHKTEMNGNCVKHYSSKRF